MNRTDIILKNLDPDFISPCEYKEKKRQQHREKIEKQNNDIVNWIDNQMNKIKFRFLDPMYNSTDIKLGFNSSFIFRKQDFVKECIRKYLEVYGWNISQIEIEEDKNIRSNFDHCLIIKFSNDVVENFEI